MTRQTAYHILTKYLTHPILLQHSLATEAAMRALAPRYNEDVEEWGITGLLHDADYQKSKGHPEQHGILLFKLEPNSIPTVIEQAIKAHNYEETHVMPESKMEWALIGSDEVTMAIFGVVQKNKTLASLTATDIIQSVQEKSFSKEIRERIMLATEKLEISLQDFIAITLSAMQQIVSELSM